MMRSFCHFRSVLPLHRKYPIYLQSKSFYTMVTLLIIGLHFSYVIFDLIEDILYPSPQASHLARLISQKKIAKNIATNSHKQLIIPIILTKLNIIPLLFTERQ